MKYIVRNCPACEGYNVFGLDTKPCCYKYHDYCENVTDCVVKKYFQTLKDCKNREVEYRNQEQGLSFDSVHHTVFRQGLINAYADAMTKMVDAFNSEKVREKK